MLICSGWNIFWNLLNRGCGIIMSCGVFQIALRGDAGKFPQPSLSGEESEILLVVNFFTGRGWSWGGVILTIQIYFKAKNSTFIGLELDNFYLEGGEWTFGGDGTNIWSRAIFSKWGEWVNLWLVGRDSPHSKENSVLIKKIPKK